MPRRDFHGFLDRSLAVVAAEVPIAYRRMMRELSDVPIRVEVDGEARVLHVSRGRHEISSEAAAIGELRTTGESILALVDGGLDLTEALLRDQLFLRGSLEVVVRSQGALSHYLSGAVRAPSFPFLLKQYRLSVEKAPKHA